MPNSPGWLAHVESVRTTPVLKTIILCILMCSELKTYKAGSPLVCLNDDCDEQACVQTHPEAHSPRLSAMQPKQDEASWEFPCTEGQHAFSLVFVFVRCIALYSRQGDRAWFYSIQWGISWISTHCTQNISPKLNRPSPPTSEILPESNCICAAVSILITNLHAVGSLFIYIAHLKTEADQTCKVGAKI